MLLTPLGGSRHPQGMLGIVDLLSPSIPTCCLLTGSALPVTAYDKNGFRILFHFAKECPPGRPDVLVVVVSMLNTAPLPIKSIVLQAAVPKVPWLPGASRGRNYLHLEPASLRASAGSRRQHVSTLMIHMSISRHLPSLQRASLFLFSQ